MDRSHEDYFPEDVVARNTSSEYPHFNWSSMTITWTWEKYSKDGLSFPGLE